MKVAKQKEAFVPLEIVIETKEEAEVLWHLLNLSVVESFSNYLRENSLDSAYPSAVKHEMWQTLNEHFSPEQEIVRGK